MTGRTIPIADAPEALTPSWLTIALTDSGVLDGARVVKATSQPIGTGQMCDCVRLDIHYDRPTDAPDSIVAKLPAADETSRATAKALRSYENEVRFYQQLAPELPIRTPTVYYADIDVESASFVLLLEDLAPAQQGDQLRGCSPGQAQIALQELVKLPRLALGRPDPCRYRMAPRRQSHQPAVPRHPPPGVVGRLPPTIRTGSQ